MYLEKRRKLYYALHDIPPSLRPAFGGKSRFVSGLGTSNLEVAKIEGAKRESEWRAEIKRIRDRVEAAGADAFARELEMSAIALERSSPPPAAPKASSSSKKGEGLFDDVHRLVPPPKAKSAHRFDAWVDDWAKLPSKKDKDKTKAAKTIHMAQTTIRRFAAAVTLAEISRGRVQSWLEVEAKERSAATIRRSLSELRSYWSYLQARELVSAELLPFDRVLVPATAAGAAKRIAFPTGAVSELVNAALAAGDSTLADVIRIGAFTGARIEEICSIRVEHVMPTHLVIEGTKTEAAKRQVPIHPHLMTTIKRLNESADADGFLIGGLQPNKFGDRSGAISKRFARLRADLKFGDQYVFHSIRKTFATALWSASVNRELISQMMGHATGHITTDVYATDPDHAAKMRAIKKINYPDYVPG